MTVTLQNIKSHSKGLLIGNSQTRLLTEKHRRKLLENSMNFRRLDLLCDMLSP